MVEYHAHLQPHDSLQELFVLQALFSQRCEDHVVEKFFFCLTGPYLTRRATIGRH